jgi:hypothetical protein
LREPWFAARENKHKKVNPSSAESIGMAALPRARKSRSARYRSGFDVSDLNLSVGFVIG